jgi:hypothetical protein
MSTRSGRRLRAAIATIGGLALAAALLAAAPAAAASPTACRVKNLDTGVTKASLQRAHNAAKAGHRLTVRGTCAGITTLRKSLTITGISTATSGKPILDAKLNGRVVTVKYGVKVTMKSLTIRRGATPGSGGGINNSGTLVLRDVVVRGNTAAAGGGMVNHGGLMLKGSTAIRGNTAQYQAGGVLNAKGMVTLTMRDSSRIIRNSAGSDGGGVFNDTATLTMKDSSRISQNTAGALGGGVANLGFGLLRMRGSSSITGNDAGIGGGGVYNEDSLLDGVRWEEPDTDDNNVWKNTPDDVYDF